MTNDRTFVIVAEPYVRTQREELLPDCDIPLDEIVAVAEAGAR
jgi:hypothetical protein